MAYNTPATVRTVDSVKRRIVSTGKAVCYFLAGAYMFCIWDLDLPGCFYYASDYDDLYTGHRVQGCASHLTWWLEWLLIIYTVSCLKWPRFWQRAGSRKLLYHKHGSAYSRTEPDEVKTGGQELYLDTRWQKTEFTYVFILSFLKYV